MIRLSVGLIALGFALNSWLRREARRRDRAAQGQHGVFWGGLAAFTSTLVQIGGPPYFAFMLPQRLEKMLVRRHDGVVLRPGQRDEGRALFRARAVLDVRLATSAALIPLAVASNMLGVWLVRVTPEALFYKITNVLVLLIGFEF